jgi:hypothetical protein
MISRCQTQAGVSSGGFWRSFAGFGPVGHHRRWWRLRMGRRLDVEPQWRERLEPVQPVGGRWQCSVGDHMFVSGHGVHVVRGFVSPRPRSGPRRRIAGWVMPAPEMPEDSSTMRGASMTAMTSPPAPRPSAWTARQAGIVFWQTGQRSGATCQTSRCHH